VAQESGIHTVGIRNPRSHNPQSTRPVSFACDVIGAILVDANSDTNMAAFFILRGMFANEEFRITLQGEILTLYFIFSCWLWSSTPTRQRLPCWIRHGFHKYNILPLWSWVSFKGITAKELPGYWKMEWRDDKVWRCDAFECVYMFMYFPFFIFLKPLCFYRCMADMWQLLLITLWSHKLKDRISQFEYTLFELETYSCVDLNNTVSFCTGLASLMTRSKLFANTNRKVKNAQP
jgi:hypothetical protein